MVGIIDKMHPHTIFSSNRISTCEKLCRDASCLLSLPFLCVYFLMLPSLLSLAIFSCFYTCLRNFFSCWVHGPEWARAVKDGDIHVNLSHHHFVESSDRQLLAITYRPITNFKPRPWLSVKVLAQPSIASSFEHELNAPAPCCGCERGATICDARRTEHVHTVTKWCLTTNLATRCVENDLID